MKKLHLIISVIIVIPVALVYGTAHQVLLPWLFHFEAGTTNLHNVLRAFMGLYLGMSTLWLAGIFNKRYWQTATVCNIIFMAGLALGRLVSFLTDGFPSSILTIGFFGETILALFGYYNLHTYNAADSTSTR